MLVTELSNLFYNLIWIGKVWCFSKNLYYLGRFLINPCFYFKSLAGAQNESLLQIVCSLTDTKDKVKYYGLLEAFTNKVKRKRHDEVEGLIFTLKKEF